MYDDLWTKHYDTNMSTIKKKLNFFSIVWAFLEDLWFIGGVEGRFVA